MARRSPSELEGGERVELWQRLRLDGAAAAERGTIVHAWFQAIGWLDDGLPPADELRAIARRVAPMLDGAELDSLMGRFHSWLGAPEIALALSRRDAAAGDVELERELRFLRREGEYMIEGVIDRLVLVRAAGRVIATDILDFKTDAIEPGDSAMLARRIEHYGPQMQAYRRAVSELYGIPEDAIAARLLFVHAGTVQAA